MPDANSTALPGSTEGERPLPRYAAPVFLLLGAACVALAFFLDDSLEAYARSASEACRRAGSIISRWMDWPEVVGLPLALGLGLAAAKRRQAARYALIVALAAGLGGLSGTVLRTVTGRARPSTTIAAGWYGMRHDGKWIVGQHAYASFPSGHTSTVAGAAGGLLAIRRRWGWMALGAIVLVAWARLFALAHHLSDVTAAAFLGLTVGYWVARRWARSPVHPAQQRG